MVWVRAAYASPQLTVCWCDGASERKPYPSDLSDEQWALIEPVITAWKDRHRSVSGHQGVYAMREIVNAIGAKRCPRTPASAKAASMARRAATAVRTALMA